MLLWYNKNDLIWCGQDLKYTRETDSDDVLGFQTFVCKVYCCFTRECCGKKVNFSELQDLIKSFPILCELFFRVFTNSLHPQWSHGEGWTDNDWFKQEEQQFHVICRVYQIIQTMNNLITFIEIWTRIWCGYDGDNRNHRCTYRPKPLLGGIKLIAVQ